jgi:hypothetical protein
LKFFAAIAFFTEAAQGGFILTTTGPGLHPYFTDTGLGLEMTWTQTGTFDNVQISANIGSLSSTPQSGTAYLQTTIFPASTFATQPITFPTGGGYVTVFSGLTLSPGTYTVRLYSPTTAGSTAWYGADTIIYSSDYGSTHLSDSSVDSGGSVVHTGLTTQLLFSITGTPAAPPSSVPEPASLVLAGSGLLAVLWTRRVSGV